MILELKNIKCFPAMSHDSTAFVGFLHVDGKKTAYCKDDGNGGMIEITPFKDMSDRLNQAIEYAQQLPARPLEGYGPIPSDLTLVISDLLEKHLDEKEELRHRKLMETAIVVAGANGKVNQYFKLQKKMTVLGLLAHTETVAMWLAEHILPQLKEGEYIANTNIPADVLAEAKEIHFKATYRKG